ncbi:MAG TPA: hypothetical protein VF944_02695 [Candidatus Bathyarchaeia archaeon]
MKYVVDQNCLGLVKNLRSAGYECVTATFLARGHEDSRERAADPKLVDFLRENRAEYSLLTTDKELAKDCEEDGLLCVLIPSPLPPFEEVRRLIATD